MRKLSDEESAQARKYLDRAYSLTSKADCLESQFGAVIFKGDSILGEGYNHVPLDLKNQFSCEVCPRRKFVPELATGVGMELCISVHAEEDAINDMLLERKHPKSESFGAKMVIARIKKGERRVPESIKPICTKCSGKILTQTEIDEIIFEVKGGLIAFKKSEFHIDSINNLYSNWANQTLGNEK